MLSWCSKQDISMLTAWILCLYIKGPYSSCIFIGRWKKVQSPKIHLYSWPLELVLFVVGDGYIECLDSLFISEGSFIFLFCFLRYWFPHNLEDLLSWNKLWLVQNMSPFLHILKIFKVVMYSCIRNKLK